LINGCQKHPNDETEIKDPSAFPPQMIYSCKSCKNEKERKQKELYE
jgi:hypothetical protein